jgi:hypothetical protein
MQSALKKTLLSGLILAGAMAAQAQHVDAGALGTSQGSQLYFENGATYVAGSGYVRTLTYSTTGRYAGTYNGGLTFTALSRLGGDEPASPNAAALGSFLELGIVSVSGPAGGNFQFWEGADQGGGSSPLVSFTSGYSASTPTITWDLSDPATAGDAGEDPYGHLHGRRFSVTGQTGTYTVGFQLVDTSVNGTGGGPIHSPSDVYYVQFSATPVPEPSDYAAIAGVSLVGFALWRRRRQG